ncbi:hypothetical protein ISS22_09015 [candidate division KSB1 bacterium]|nr:hypothetical protein [candidate division KSB1 bacterium]
MNKTLNWLLDGDPSIRWQTLRDLSETPVDEYEKVRAEIAVQGWGAELLSKQDPSGTWAGGLYSPKWISTTYSMLLLRRLGLQPEHPQALKGCALLIDKGFYQDGGIAFSKSWGRGETCVTGMVLSILSYFHYQDERISRLVEHLLEHQMEDGGWNCQSYKGATHSSFHTTISVLEGLREFEKTFNEITAEVQKAQQTGREFLLQHRLFRSSRTGEIVKPVFTRFSFPPRWHYDILRVLDYFQECNAERDNRLIDAIEIVHKKRKKDGRWLLQSHHPGKVFFDMEKVSEPSRWNTLRALRVLKWWNKE